MRRTAATVVLILAVDAVIVAFVRAPGFVESGPWPLIIGWPLVVGFPLVALLVSASLMWGASKNGAAGDGLPGTVGGGVCRRWRAVH
jgi:hypothetical protein